MYSKKYNNLLLKLRQFLLTKCLTKKMNNKIRIKYKRKKTETRLSGTFFFVFLFMFQQIQRNANFLKAASSSSISLTRRTMKKHRTKYKRETKNLSVMGN